MGHSQLLMCILNHARIAVELVGHLVGLVLLGRGISVKERRSWQISKDWATIRSNLHLWRNQLCTQSTESAMGCRIRFIRWMEQAGFM